MNTLLELRNKFGAEIVLISVAPGYAGDTVETLYEYQVDSDFRWFIALDTSGVSLLYAADLLPTTVIIDRNMRISARQDGVVSFKFLENKISTLLREQPRVQRATNLAHMWDREQSGLISKIKALY